MGLGALGAASVASGMTLGGCSSTEAGSGSASEVEVNTDFKEATQFTKDYNKSFAENLPFDDVQDFDDAQKGWIATVDGDGLYNADGQLIWDLKSYEYQGEGAECPDTVNPSLWRQAQLNNFNGLFKVADGVYQVRNLDLANLTIIEGETGIIIVDCTSSNEAAKAGLELYRKHVDADREIKAICITHSHTDHYGGIGGLLTADQMKSGDIPIVVPQDYMLEVISENAFAGDIMSRRTYDQYGTILDHNPQAHVDTGLAKQMVNGASRGIVPPTLVIEQETETHEFDGVKIEFMLTPDTEAPAEYIMWLPDFKMLIPAELVNHTFHNLYTLRGAQARDARQWWMSIDKMIERYGSDVEVMCLVHTWPTWGNEACMHLLEVSRDGYKCMHDQCLRMMNQGLTMDEVAEEFVMPESLAKEWALRGYYGSWRHDAKGVYQRYLGWFDMNPSHLNNLPPEEAAKKYVEAFGGEDALLGLTKKAFDEGDYRWAAELGNHLVFANPSNNQALSLLADTYEQMGYQCECATWRCVYLMGAKELRVAIAGKSANPSASSVSAALADAMPDNLFFDFMALHLNAPRVGNDEIAIQVEQSDKQTTWALRIKNGVLNFHQDKQYPSFDAKLTLKRDDLSQIIIGNKTIGDFIGDGTVAVDGDAEKVKTFFSYFDVFHVSDINVMLP